MHRILQRQIKKYIGDIRKIPAESMPFLDAVSNTYSDFDKDYEMLDRSLELSSKEFAENNQFLREAKASVEKIVHERTLELEKTKDMLQEKNKSLAIALSAKNDFIRIANHQLNTPLSIMQNAYSMVSSKSLTPKQGLEYWEIGLKRMSHVIEDFWNVLQSDQQIQYDIKKTNIKPIVEDSVDNAKKIVVTSKKNIKIVIEKPDFVIPPVLCDAKKIDHVVHNLLDNAINYTKKGTITVSYQMFKDNNYLKINFKDTGIGFSPEDKEKIGEKFYRTKDAMLFHPDGSGLGFYICKNIVENNGGELFYDSEGKNKGSTFAFTLPIFK